MMKYEIPVMDVICWNRNNVVTTSNGLVDGDDTSDGTDFAP